MVSEVDAQPAIQRDVATEEHCLVPPDAGGNVCQVAAICGLLLLAVGLVFGQTVHHDFCNLDDTGNVYLNPHVTGGLTVEAVKWAFTERYMGVWLPVTWISHMLDWQLYGHSAGGHHLTNVLLHAATAVLLFLVLRRMTGRLWPSALVAAVFAVHPLRVESVAWITERKDVLSGLFFVLALGAYVGYVRHRFSVVRYAAVIVLFALGLMAKPMLVTLPFLLLLLDYWPLGRWTVPASQDRSPEGKRIATTASEPMPEEGFRQAAPPARGWRLWVAGRLLLEKVPLLALTACSCLVAIWAYGSEGVNLLDQRFALPWRIGNAPLSYVSYLGMFFYPVNLATPYPRPTLDLPLLKIVGAVVLLAVLTAAAILGRRRRPYLLVGWLWYLGMLVPVSGIFQFGMQTMADRFTYLPQIGLCIALAWFLADALRSWPPRRLVYSLAAALLLAVLTGSAWRQTSFWHDNVKLWNHTLACTSRNRLAHHALGNTFQDLGEFEKAIEQYQAAIAIEPDYVMSHYNLAVALAAVDRLNEAIEQYRITVDLEPENALAHNNLGNALSMQGRLEEAMLHCQEALRIDPQFAEAHSNAGDIWNYLGRVDDAVAEYQQALKLKPDFAPAHYPLGLIFARRGRLDDAIAEYRKALDAKPPFAAFVHNSLGLALAARGRPDEAVEHYRSALDIRPDFSEARRNLDRVLAGSRRPIEKRESGRSFSAADHKVRP